MVLQKGVPFKHTLHPTVSEEKSLLSIPISITATVAECDLQHRLDIHVPSSREIAGIELTNVEFLFENDTKGELSDPRCSSGNYDVLGYLFMQLLDSQGRPTSHPFAVMRCDPVTGRGICCGIKLPLQADQRVRFYLVQKVEPGDEKMRRCVRIEGVRFTGKAQLLSGGTHIKSAKGRRQIKALMESNLRFEVDSARKELSLSKRHRESPLRCRYDKQESLTGRSSVGRTANILKKKPNDVDDDDDDDDEPPNLIYAFVPGGDNES
ncbi:hypothetical protein DQ04_11101020 [Trypanosoma grayi]|uniref:hypothetical protein n=1 Tax=Trypanosoma grayi TaxID=71804 RepID=UPI0004F3FB12|nr:hypothetical protein DQ04_11101020 [Trypanosoma grayi]KEG07054.1 hypothetical protein DQ04_11101020 [Trypanosoma grayi]